MKASGFETWRWPAAIGVVTLAGLACALVGDGAWDAASWVALGLPVAVCCWFGLKRDRG